MSDVRLHAFSHPDTHSHSHTLCHTAFQISLSGKDKPGYCGYGVANTAFRLAVACLTFIIGALLPFDLVKVSNEILYWAFFTLGVLWYSATVSDCTALANSTQACKDSWEDYSNVSCENDIYGVTIAVDFVGSVSVLLCWVLCDGVSMLVPPALSQKDAASNQA
eukprot:scaffold440_cov277-Ochromonas_danica.AAC.15